MPSVRRITPPPVTALTFGCVPHTDDELTRSRLLELCAWLSTHLGVIVRAHRAPSPEALASAFGAGRIDVAWVSPALLITAPQLEQARPLVSSIRQGMASYHSVLYVQQGSRYRSVADLAGARAAWVAPTSAAGYIVPRLSLAGYGFDPRTVFSSETFYDSHGNAARAVHSGHADVGATFAVFDGGDPTARLTRAGFEEVAGGPWARILHAAGPIPSDPIVIAPRVDAQRRVAITEAFTTGHADIAAAIAHVLGADSFEAIRPGAFDRLREDIQMGRELGLL
ncbi:MAG TPA: phosphate/phosphite/phosphonate ABC transporter substrate-binding protein [Polyangiaceae bacterium]|nr:phosphate/phosphite/phosphonate ABC transporter substrate-binding protein [Polyangiaceae bacterium]